MTKVRLWNKQTNEIYWNTGYIFILMEIIPIGNNDNQKLTPPNWQLNNKKYFKCPILDTLNEGHKVTIILLA